MAFSPSQQKSLDRRTTPSSRKRLADKLRATNKKADVGASQRGVKPNLGTPPAKPTSRKGPRPATPPPVGRSAQPDSLYYDRIDTAARQGESRLNNLESQEQAVRSDFGIEDPTNPFSRAEGLKRMFLQRYRGASAGIAARGHLYSGQHERALARTRREEEEARANLRAQYEGIIGQIGAAKAGVKFDTEEQRAQAFEDWLARAPESEAPSVSTGAGPDGVTPMLTRGGDGTAPAAINPALALPAPTGAARTPSAAPKVKTKPNLKVKPKGNAKDILKRASKRR